MFNLMKKRILSATPTLLVAALCLFSVLTTKAQVFTSENDGVATVIVDQNGKSVIQYMEATDAIAAIRSEVTASYPTPVQDENSAANATQIYGRMLYIKAGRYIGDTNDVAGSIHKAWIEVRSLSNSKWPNLISQQDYDDMVTLLSL